MNLCNCEWAKRSGKGFIIPMDRIRVGPWGNARTDITDEMVEQKALSLLAHGQKKPLMGILSSDGEWFELTDGELRLRAARSLKKTCRHDFDIVKGGLYCEIESGFSSGGKTRYPTTNEAIKLQLSYGTDSEPLSEYDKARSVSKLVEAGERISDLAIILHCSEQSIRNLLTINSVPDRVKNAMKPTIAAKYARASIPTRNKIDIKISSGEKIRGRDISSKKQEAIKVSQEKLFAFNSEPFGCKDGHAFESIAKVFECRMCGIMECTRPDIYVSKIPYEEKT